MQRSFPLCARGSRGKSLLSFLKKGETAASSATPEAKTMSEEQREKLRSMKGAFVTEEQKPTSEARMASSSTVSDIEGILDEDTIKSRGIAKYAYNYAPPAKIEEIVKSECLSVLREVGETVDAATLTAHSFQGNNAVKYKILLSVAQIASGHLPVNGRLHHMKTIQDVIDFYSMPVKNTSDYVEMARSTRKPANLTVLEKAARFHPEDVEAWHGGITAYPGTGGQVYGLRNQRLLRQFKPKDKWFDYEDQAFDYIRLDENMPWDPEMVKKMDSFPDRQYNLSTKKFGRTDKGRMNADIES